MNQPDPVLITKLAGYGAMIVPPKYIKQHGTAYFATHPIGTGAYRVTRYVRGAEVDMTRYNHWWGGRAKMKNIIFRFQPEDATRLANLQTGHIDIMQKVATGQIGSVKSNTSLKLYPVPSTTVEGLFLNGRIKPTNNQDIRQAIDYAIDKKSIIKDILLSYGRDVSSWQSRLSFGYDPSQSPYPYDPAKAKALVAASKVKSPGLSFEIDGTDTIFKQVAEVIVAELQQVGFHVDLKTVDPTVLYNTNIPKGTYGNVSEFVWGGWTMDFDNTAYSLYYCGQIYNPGYCNKQMNSLLTQERTTLNQAKRLSIFKKIDAMLHNQEPTVPLFQTVNLWAASTHVHNFVAPPDDRMELQNVTLK
jgi:peptide/nickel transport system substrate-binding protein